jgi:uncharacterized Zn finger protein
VAREDAASKGRRLLTEGRLGVTSVQPEAVEAFVRGDSAEFYRVGFRDREWWCSCPSGAANPVRCSHVRALQIVVVISEGPET